MLQNHVATGNPDHGRFCLAGHSSNLKIQSLEMMMMMILMTMLNAYFSVVYFLKTKVGSGGSSADGAKSGDTATALETRKMLFSIVSRALIFKKAAP
jgi:hypothetical protein